MLPTVFVCVVSVLFPSFLFSAFIFSSSGLPHSLLTFLFFDRTGYAADGSRLVAGVVAVSVDRRRVLVVESTNRVNHWVLPKGGYETDEARPEDAATRMHPSSPHFHFSPRRDLRLQTIFFLPCFANRSLVQQVRLGKKQV
jgi:hypothetical protein